MRKRILMLMFGCILAVGIAFSQSSSTTKQINDIKRAGQYFYAESTLETEQEAREAATLMLANFINDYVNSNNLPQDKKVKESDLAKAQSLSMKRGPMTRVFLYVKKSDFIPVENTNATSVKQESAIQESEIKKNSVEVAETNKLEDRTTVNAAKQTVPIEEKKVEVKQVEPLSEQSEGKTTVQLMEKSTVQPTEQTATDENAGSLRLSVDWQQAAIDAMLKEPSLKEVMVTLSRLKAEYKVKRFGTYNECKNAALSFWVVCESDSNMSIITILGPGTDKRVNFKSLQYDSLGNYSGKNVIWFELAK